MYSTKLIIVMGLCVGGIGAQNASFQDLLDLLNTTLKIYVYATSYLMYRLPNEVTCLYYSKLDLQEMFFRVDVNYNVGSQRYSKEVTGVLRNDTPTGDPVMQPYSWPGPFPFAPRHLKYYDKKNHCGVFLLNVTGQTHCELHIWETGIKKEDNFYSVRKICLRSYNIFCGGEKPMVIMYTSNCDTNETGYGSY
ncbi:uncharacterized protein LOC142817981 isoform X1 [Rhipicephalus microplus]|uniref:uncharacterized protein LOC142817981 isoform X1 n=1 Tax=Rhipicephalus microplus TaxID=6941 RepID=UPI003F6C2194